MIVDYLGLTKYWADGRHTFRLRVGEIRALEARTKMGLQFLYLKIEQANGTFDEVTETIRLFLIGGGEAPETAERLVDDYVIRPSRYSAAVELAAEILAAHLQGAPEEELPKSESPGESNGSDQNSQMVAPPSENSITQ